MAMKITGESPIASATANARQRPRKASDQSSSSASAAESARATYNAAAETNAQAVAMPRSRAPRRGAFTAQRQAKYVAAAAQESATAAQPAKA